MNNLLELLGYHRKWHGSVQAHRPRFDNSINEHIISHIFKVIDIPVGNFVEFGAIDGKINSNTYKLFQNGWSGLYIESNKKHFKKLEKNFKNNSRVYVSDVHVDLNNRLDNVINDSIKSDIDFMSIDIDGLDLEVFKSIEKYFPKILCIEGGQILEPFYKTVESTIASQNIQQSLFQITKTLNEKGYKLICSYQDTFFVRDEYKNKFDILEDLFDAYLNGLLALPRIPYIKFLLDKVDIKNRVIDYIIYPFDKTEFNQIMLSKDINRKALWVDEKYYNIFQRVINLKKMRKIYPYDENNEKLWEKVSEY